MAVCPQDTVTNFYFNDAIPNDDPCYLAELMKGSVEEAATQDIPSSEESTLEVGLSALLDAILNGGVECQTKLQYVLADFACNLAADYDLSQAETVHVRVMEGLSAEEVIDIGSLASCGCNRTSAFIVNMVLPSFCSSSCIQTTTCRLGYSEQEADWILYRYQLRNLKGKINSQRCGLKKAASEVARMTRQEAKGPYEPYLKAQVDYVDVCLPEVSAQIPLSLHLQAPSYPCAYY